MVFYAHPPLFDFEIEASQDLIFIPLCVRYNLDRCGRRISLADWQAVPYAARVRLACFPLDEATVTPDFATVLDDLMYTCAGTEPERFTPDVDPVAGSAAGPVPEPVQEQCRLAGVLPLSAQAWHKLAPLERYALIKLSRKPTPNHDFPAAFAEFGLAGSDGNDGSADR